MIGIENCGVPLGCFGDASPLRLLRGLAAAADNSNFPVLVGFQYCGRDMDRAFISRFEMNQLRDKFVIRHGDDILSTATLAAPSRYRSDIDLYCALIDWT